MFALFKNAPVRTTTSSNRQRDAARSNIMKIMSIKLFQYRGWQRRGRGRLRYGRPFEQRTVERNIVRGHACGRKSSLEPLPNSMTIERKHLRQHHHRLIHRVNEGARDALVDDFRNGTPAECKDRCTARHRLDHYQAERLRAIDWEKERPRPSPEFGLCA